MNASLDLDPARERAILAILDDTRVDVTRERKLGFLLASFSLREAYALLHRIEDRSREDIVAQRFDRIEGEARSRLVTVLEEVLVAALRRLE